MITDETHIATVKDYIHEGNVFRYFITVIWMRSPHTMVAQITAEKGCLCKISLGQ